MVSPKARLAARLGQRAVDPAAQHDDAVDLRRVVAGRREAVLERHGQPDADRQQRCTGRWRARPRRQGQVPSAAAKRSPASPASARSSSRLLGCRIRKTQLAEQERHAEPFLPPRRPHSREPHQSRSQRDPKHVRQVGQGAARDPGGERRDRHGRGRVHRHAGAADRQAGDRALLPRCGARGMARLQLPADRRHGDGAGAGLQGGVVGEGLWRLRRQARPRHAAADPLAARHRAGPGRRLRPSRPRAAVQPAHHAQAPAAAAEGARLHRQDGLRARVLRLRRQLRRRPARRATAISRPPAGTSRTTTSSRPPSASR